MSDDPDRRKFLKLATCGVGGALGAAVVLPALSLVVHPSRVQTVTTPKDPLDVGAAADLGAAWTKVEVVAPEVRDAWISARDVVLGGAFVRVKAGKPEALSAVCPHLGCPVGFDGKSFLCPCHDSRFGDSGETIGAGPAKRGLDPLPVEIVDGRLRLTWLRYKLDTVSREPA
jgi:Rieske Fe-S protein